MSTMNISLIKDPTDSILAHRTQLPNTVIPIYFKRLSATIETVDRSGIGDVEMGDQSIEIEIPTIGKCLLTISTSALASIFETVRASISPSHPTTIGIIWGTISVFTKDGEALG